MQEHVLFFVTSKGAYCFNGKYFHKIPKAAETL